MVAVRHAVAGGLVGVVAGIAAMAPAHRYEVPPYDRAAFGSSWSDLDGDCQDTRAEVLIRESSAPVLFRTLRGCVVSRGRWVDEYSGHVLELASEIDIDHRVPLRAAWDGGAWKWSNLKRLAFANDMTAGHLVITHRTHNRSKGAKGPADWWPPAARLVPNRARVPTTPAACVYADRWHDVKLLWGLSYHAREIAALRAVWAACGVPSE